MTPELLPGIIYAAIVLIALVVPYATWGKTAWAADRSIAAALTGCALLLTVARHGAVSIFSLVLLLPVLGLGLGALLGAVDALLLFEPVTWWSPNLQLGPAAACLFILLGAGASYLPRLGAAPADSLGPRSIVPTFALASLLGIAGGLLTAPFASLEPIYFAWHHWGAYLSPVDAWLAGGLPYRDFPIQYGIGPTALLAGVCGSDCWRGIYGATVVANALYFAVLAGCVVLLSAGKSRGFRWLALAALWCSSFVWTAFPADVGSTVMTPSVAGLRFLPVALLLLHILSAESGGRHRDWLGHAIWLGNLFWSPEGAFFGTLMWWPYLAMRDAAGAPNFRERWLAVFRGALRGLIALAFGLVLLWFSLQLLSAGAMRLEDFLAYILNPPGRMPINPSGTVWLALAAILLGVSALVGTVGSMRGRMLYACLLAFLGAGTYYLSRSHDNNVLNLFPLLVVLLIAGTETDESGGTASIFRDAFVRTVLAAMVAFVAAAHWASWAQGARTGRLMDIGPSRLIAYFTPQPGAEPQMLPSDALKGLSYLRGRSAGAVVLIDENRVIPRHGSGEGWTGVNNMANFEPLPRDLVTRFICRGALSYERPGWILVDERRYSAWVPMFEAGYSVRELVGFGSYRAYHLFPRVGPLKCAEH